MAKAGVRAPYVFLDPVAPAGVPNGALFLDSTNGNTPTVKGTGGNVDPISPVATSNILIKQMQAAGAIALNRPVSKRADGKIEFADSDSISGQNVVGFAQQVATADGDLINVLCVGANIVGAITGLGFTPGQEIYLSEDGLGYSNDPGSFTGNNDSIIKVGIADCAAGTASATASDLILFPEVVARP